VTAEMCVIVAAQSQDWTAGAAAADTAGGVDMRPDNVSSWFTKVSRRCMAWAAFGRAWHAEEAVFAACNCSSDTIVGHI